MLGWVWSFFAVWESFTAPMGRWGPYAFPLVGEKGEVYVVDGRRIWVFVLGSWQEAARLPEEVRTGTFWKGDTLLLGGLNGAYWGPLHELQWFALPGTGWAYRFWAREQGLLLRSASGCTWIAFRAGHLSAEPLIGTCIGATGKGGLVWRQDSLYVWPEGRFLSPLRGRWTEITQIAGQLYGLTDRGEVYVLPQPGAVLGTGRTWVGPYLMTERSLLTWPARSLLLQTDLPLYAASLSPSGDLLVALTPTEALFIYPRAPLRWKHQWPFPVTQVKAVGGRWIAWQGETAFSEKGERRYPATLLEATLYQGKWIWATPRGLLWEDGTPWGEVGRYVSTVAAHDSRLAWAVGLEVYVQEGPQQTRFRFSAPVRRVAWEGKQLWVWQKNTLYRRQGKGWQAFALPFAAQEGTFWEGSWYFQVGGRWIQVTEGKVRDTLARPPWIASVPPLPFAWGRPLLRTQQRDSLLIFTTRGLLVYTPTAGEFPPIRWKASLQGPALRPQENDRFTLPTERPYIELNWRAQVPFLPKLLEVWAQIGEAPPRRLEQPTLLLSLSSPGRVVIRLWATHPWCPAPKAQTWEIEVQPPWYDTWTARIGAVLVLVLIVLSLMALREWNLRQVQRRLTAEREQLLRQTQSQQAQLLQSERMANLGLMAAHIAHEINTPLGVIRSGLTELEEAQKLLRPPYPLPEEPRPSSVRMRELRSAWQSAFPTLPPVQVQQLAALGYTPTQKPLLKTLLNDPEAWQRWQNWLTLTFALQRAHEAAEKLYSRVQTIRTYVRQVEDLPATPVALQESLQATLSFYQPLMRQLQLITNLPSEPLYVLASPARLEQVWANLLQNAIQATPPGGEIRISLKASDGHAEVLFQDSGKGIPPAHWQAIFEPLFTTKAPGEGTGLGLPLCRQIIESYGGTLQLLHSEPGFTLFRVRLPLTIPTEKGSEPSAGAPPATEQ